MFRLLLVTCPAAPWMLTSAISMPGTTGSSLCVLWTSPCRLNSNTVRTGYVGCWPDEHLCTAGARTYTYTELSVVLTTCLSETMITPPPTPPVSPAYVSLAGKMAIHCPVALPFVLLTQTIQIHSGHAIHAFAAACSWPRTSPTTLRGTTAPSCCIAWLLLTLASQGQCPRQTMQLTTSSSSNSQVS